MCFCLDDDHGLKRGQLAHIDRNPENDAPENLAFLCAAHHDEYDITSLQTKGYKADELRKYQEILHAYMESWAPQLHTKRSRNTPGRRAGRRAGVSLEVYDRRIPIYHKTIQFVRDVASDLRPEIKLILKFSSDTEEALFLFDENIAEYLTGLFNRALRLHTVDLMRAGMWTDDRDAEKFAALVKEQTDLAVWFTEQHREIRTRFAPYLRLA